MPKKFTKYRKLRAKVIAIKGHQLEYGFIGLKAQASGKITQQQVESMRVTINRALARKGNLINRVNVFFPVSKKPVGVRMGGGKGANDTMVCPVGAGAILFELANTDMELAKVALKKAMYKLHIPCKIVVRKFYNQS